LPRNDSIDIVHSSKLDRTLWDHCVEADSDGLIYSYSWFLDAIAEEWFGLVVGDYKAVLPLPVKRKYGVQMIAMPAFMQRSDISGDANYIIQEAGKAIKRHCRIVQFATACTNLFPGTPARMRTNYVLPLTGDYSSIFDNYSQACRKNINKAHSRGCTITENISINDVVSVYKKAYGEVSGYTDLHFSRLEQLISLVPKERYHLVGVLNESGSLVYAGVLLDDNKRLYYLLGAPTKEGRTMRATYFFIDAMVQRFATTRKLFDFEGSDIPAVARFYQSFSPEAEYYYQYYFNNFPFPLNRLIDTRLNPG